MIFRNFQPEVKKVFYFIYFIIFLIICSFFLVSQYSIRKIKNFVRIEQKQALDITKMYENVFSQFIYVGRILEQKFNKQKILKEIPELEPITQIEKSLSELEEYITQMGYLENWSEIKNSYKKFSDYVLLLHSNFIKIREYIVSNQNILKAFVSELKSHFNRINSLVYKALSLRKYSFYHTLWNFEKVHQIILLSIQNEINKLEQTLLSENYEDFEKYFLSNIDIQYDLYLANLENFINDIFKFKISVLEYEIEKEVTNEVKEFKRIVKKFKVNFHTIKANLQNFKEKFEKIYSETNLNFYDLLRLMRLKIDILWIEITEKSENLVKETANEFINRFIRLMIFSFLILLLLAFIPMVILNPIEELKHEFTNITPYKFNLSSRRFFIKEFDELYKSFTFMIAQIQNHIEIHSRYLKTIAQIRIIFSTLYETILSDDQNFRKSRNEAVQKFFNLLSSHMPEIVHISIYLDENQSIRVIENSNFTHNLEPTCASIIKSLPNQLLVRLLIGSKNNIPLPTTNEHETSFTEIPLIPIKDVIALLHFNQDQLSEYKNMLLHNNLDLTNIKVLLLRLGYKGLIIDNSDSEWIGINSSDTKGLYIYFIFNTQNESLSSSDHLFLSIIAQNISTLLDVSDLLLVSLKQREINYQLRFAKEIQEKSLPSKIIEDKNYKIDAKVEMSAEVGGDYYDIIKFEDGKIGVVVADVSGKNVSAALLTMLLKASLYSLERKNMLPSQLLTRLNDIMLELLPEGTFITLIYAIFDSNSSKLIWSNAGHTPIIYISKNSALYKDKDSSNTSKPSKELKDEISSIKSFTTTTLSNPSIPIGITPTKYVDNEIIFNKDDRFIFYTDGIIDQRNSKKINFGIEKLLELISSNPEIELSEIISEVRKFSGKINLDDDVTLVSVKII